MKKIILIALALLPLGLRAQNVQFTVKLKDKSAPESSKILLLYEVDGKSIVDSARTLNGMVTFHGMVPSYPVTARLWGHNAPVGYSNGHLPDQLILFLEKGTISVSTKDSLKKAVVTGTKMNEDYGKYRVFMERPLNGLMELNKEGVLAMMTKKNTPKFENEYRPRYKQGVDVYKAAQLDYIKTNPGSLASIIALNEWGGANINADLVEPDFKSLSAAVQNSKPGKDLADRIHAARTTGIGVMAPVFTQPDTNGKAISLVDFRGKYVLLDFWASWCGPCRAENPNYVKAYQTYKDKGFTLLGVSLDGPNAKAAWLAAIKKDGLMWTQVSDLKYWNNDVAKMYDIKAIPQNFLIDPSGKIIAKNLRGAALEAKLNEVMNKKP